MGLVELQFWRDYRLYKTSQGKLKEIPIPPTLGGPRIKYALTDAAKKVLDNYQSKK